MAGMLEELLAGNPELNRVYAGLGIRPSEQPVVETDYSTGWPIEMTRKKKTGTEEMDDALAGFRAANPAPPPQMQPQSPIAGLLGGQISAVPPGDGGNPVPPPPQAAPPQPLPPPVNVAPPPQVAAVPQQPPAMPGVAPQGAPTDVSAASRGPTSPAVPQATPDAPKGFLQRLDDATVKNAGLLLGLGAGFAGAPSFGTGMSRGFAGAAAGTQQDQALASARQKSDLQTSGIRNTYMALVKAGVPPHVALAAAQNPEILKQVAPDYLGTRKSEIKEIKEKDAFGNERTRLMAINPYDPSDIKEVTPGAAPAAGGDQSIGVKSPTTFAPGVTMDNFNHAAVGDDYLKQFSPEVQAGVKAYMRGDSLPTGRQAQAQVIKQIAQKYGGDIGVDASDQAYYQRKNFSTSLGNTNSGVGMQAKGFQQGLEHMTELADKLEKLGNWNGLGAEPIANAANYVRGQTTSQADIRKGVDAAAQALAGEIGKLYSGSSGGGVHEREATKKLFGPNLSGPALAGALESSLELMQGGLRTLEQRRNELYPNGQYPKGADFMGEQQQKAINRIHEVISRLRGEESAPSAAPPSAGKVRVGDKEVGWSIVRQ